MTPSPKISASSDADGVWNLVLACRHCNRGLGGKMARVPYLPLVERLNRRNDYLIDSHHPLRETLIRQTGASPVDRRYFLQRKFDDAVSAMVDPVGPQAPPTLLRSAYRKALHEAARVPPGDYRDNPQHRVPHHRKWSGFTPPLTLALSGCGSQPDRQGSGIRI